MRLIVAFGCLWAVLLWESHVLQAMAHNFSKEDINQGDQYGETALHAAAFAGRENKIGPLLKAGAKINARDNIGETPLHKAVFMNHYAIAEMLIKAGADVLAKNNQGETAYDIFEHNRLDGSRVLDAYQKRFKEALENKMWQTRFDDLKKMYESQKKKAQKRTEVLRVQQQPQTEQKVVEATMPVTLLPMISPVQPVFQEEEDLNEVPVDVMVHRSCVAMLRKVFSTLMSCGKR